jgi:enoyl-CoA hydratase
MLQLPQFENLLLQFANHLLTITINRPAKLNALNFKTIEEVGQAITFAQDTADIRAVILTGAGEKAFVAGADIAELTQLSEINGRKLSEKGHDIFNRIENSHKPIVAAVNGFALGGGCELAMACHLRIASENAKFGQPEVNLGLIPGYGGTQRLAQLIGKGKALEYLMTGDIINAETALSLGLVNYVVSQAELLEKTLEIVNKIIVKAPIAVGHVIDCVNARYAGYNGYQTEANLFGNCFRTEDFKEGTSAFLEKRKAVFKGK